MGIALYLLLYVWYYRKSLNIGKVCTQYMVLKVNVVYTMRTCIHTYAHLSR